MKFTLSWLKRHLDTNATLEEICGKLTAIGLEVEHVEDRAKIFEPFTVATVESAEKHPDADKLQVCKVRTASGMLQVVCGAPNARTGMKAIFAPEGSYIPGSDITLKKGVIRGVESQGMLVSEREMGLSEEHAGIIEVDGKYEIGTPLADIYALGDAVIEINLTPNRVDCAGVRGIARDLAAAGLGVLKPLDEAPVKGTFKSPVDVEIEDKEGCPLFLGRYVRGVKNGPSPAWLQTLLKSVGLRPISALVDVTNFMSMDLCRPLHVFDADRLMGNITVRATKKGERLDALNDKTYEVTGGATGIYDENGIAALGGIIGGIPTSCTETTTNVFIEAAYFNPERISRSGRELQIDSDARYRFERGIDPAFTASGMEIATKLILELCGGEASEIVQAGAAPDVTRTIDFSPAYVERLIGIDVAPARQKDILEALGFKINDAGLWKVTTPSWRQDVEGRADLAEEISRIHGFEHIPAVSVRAEASVAGAAETPLLAKSRKARIALAARGFQECVTWSFMSKDHARQFNDNRPLDALTLRNPISADLDAMRPSILPNLIAAATRNQALGYPDVALSEIGPVFSSPKPDGQTIIAGGVRAGSMAPRSWMDSNAARAVDAFDAKADALAVLEAAGIAGGNAQVSRDVPTYYHPGRSGALKLGSHVLAYFGDIHPGIAEELNVKTPMAGFEVFLQNIPEARKKTERALLKLDALQPVRRDFAFLVDDKVEADTLARAAKSADKALIREAFIFDIYTGKGVEPGKKSVALSVTIQPKDATLTDVELESLAKKIIEAVISKTGGVLRG